MLASVRSRVLGRGKQAPAKPPQPVQVKARSRSPEESLLLLVPSEGGMSFRLFSVENEEAAAAFLEQEFPRLGGTSLAFWPLKAKPQAGAGQTAEALVLISDPARPGVVYLSSFETMEDAESFMRFEIENGLDPHLVMTYWGVPRPVETMSRGPLPPETVREVSAPPAVQAEAVIPSVAPAPARTPPPLAAAAPAPAVAVPAAKAPARTVAVPVTRAPAPRKAATPAKPADEKAQGPGLIEAMREWPGWDTLRARITDAAMFRWEVYEDIKKDPIASSQARVIVATGAAAAGIGAFWAGPLAIVAYTIAGLLGWLAFAYLTYWVGTTVFPGRKSDETSSLLFKSLGIAHAPRVLILSGLVLPLFSPLIALAVFLWVLAAAVPATQYALELDRESATLTAIAGGLALFAVSLIIPAVII